MNSPSAIKARIQSLVDELLSKMKEQSCDLNKSQIRNLIQKSLQNTIQGQLGTNFSLSKILEEKLSQKCFTCDQYGQIIEKQKIDMNTVNYRKRGRPLKNQQQDAELADWIQKSNKQVFTKKQIDAQYSLITKMKKRNICKEKLNRILVANNLGHVQVIRLNKNSAKVRRGNKNCELRSNSENEVMVESEGSVGDQVQPIVASNDDYEDPEYENSFQYIEQFYDIDMFLNLDSPNFLPEQEQNTPSPFLEFNSDGESDEDEFNSYRL